jgi:hypothetical protein
MVAAFRLTFILLALATFAGCGKNNAVNTTSFAIPATIGLLPTPTASLELGTYLTFTATPEDATKKGIVEPITYVSSNPTVVTVAANGLACAGSWDSLTNPQICTPGVVGIADITATAQGVSSPTTRVYVHQHITNIKVQPFAPTNFPPPNPTCQSVLPNAPPQNASYYAATAYAQINGQLLDITPTVGQFNWQPITAGVVKFSNTAAPLGNMVGGVSLNQVQGTAVAPGITQFYATVGNSTSVPSTFEACPVQSIALTVTSGQSNSKTMKATVTDILGNVLFSAPLTWSSSQPGSVMVSGSTSGTNTATATEETAGGGASIIASCSPPTCNIGFSPSMPIYPDQAVFQTGKASTNAQTTVYVSSTGCGTTDNCFTGVVPVTYPGNTLGSTSILSATPDSMLFDRQGAKIYLGTDTGLLGSRGLSIVNASSSGQVSQYTAAPGKALAVSPDGTKVIVSDTKDTPNRVFVVDTTTTVPTSIALPIAGATAAGFSPDSVKAFIVGGSTLYVYSKVDSLQTIPLAAPATDVAFLAEGAVGYIAGGDPVGVSFLPTCYDPAAGPALGNVNVPGAQIIRALPDGVTMLTLGPPNIQTFTVALGGTAQDGLIGCPEPRGYVTVTNTPNSAVNLGQGTFTAKQLVVSQDGSNAYIISPDFSSVLAFSIGGLTIKSIPLTGNALPIQADISPDGSRLFVVASDGQVHELDTGLLSDVVQTSFPQNFCFNSAGQGENFNCSPDLIAVKP